MTTSKNNKYIILAPGLNIEQAKKLMQFIEEGKDDQVCVIAQQPCTILKMEKGDVFEIVTHKKRLKKLPRWAIKMFADQATDRL